MKYFQKLDSRVDFDSIELGECLDSHYIKPQRVFYKENGKQKIWDVVRSNDSVAILLYHQEFESFLIVRQFRVAVYLNNNDGYTYELCAGLVDKKNKTLEEIASEEVLEECGYYLEPSKLSKIASFYNSTGTSGSKQTIFFAKISEKDRRTQGGGIDDECIEVLFLPLKKARTFLEDDTIAKTSGLGYAFEWYMDKFLQRK